MPTKPSVLCVHTADVHVAAFGRAFAEAAGDIHVEHDVRADWLEEARRDGLAAGLVQEIVAMLHLSARDYDAVLCTCSTLGAAVDEASRHADGRIVRIDRALMERAAAHQGTVLIALCLESSKAGTLALFQTARAGACTEGHVAIVDCASAWSHFEAGDGAAFASIIATHVRAALTANSDAACVVLAQASMAPAASLLADLRVPVYTSPGLAVMETAARARKRRAA